MSRLADYLIHKLGGFTRAEQDALQVAWDKTVAAMQREGKVVILEGHKTVQGAQIDGSLIVAPGAHAWVTNNHFMTKDDSPAMLAFGGDFFGALCLDATKYPIGSYAPRQPR